METIGHIGPDFIVDVGNELVVIVRSPGTPRQEVLDAMPAGYHAAHWGGWVTDVEPELADTANLAVEAVRDAMFTRPYLTLHPEERAARLNPQPTGES